MPIGLSVAIALLAQAAPPPAVAATPERKVPAAKTAEGCRTAPPSHDATEIIVCAERPQGYRLNPDVVAAKRARRNDVRGKPTAHMKDNNCASVGPAGCIGAAAGINLLGAALTAAEMAAKLARGVSIASMFVTTPEASEYDLYLAAKRRREAEEAAAAAQAAAKLRAAAAPASQSAAPTP